MITAVGVVIPARNEQDRIAACLRSVRAALRELPPSIDRAVTVVLDRCTDGTPTRVAVELADWPEAMAVHLGATLDPVTGLGDDAVVEHTSGLVAGGAGPVGIARGAPATVGRVPAPVGVATEPVDGADGLGSGPAPAVSVEAPRGPATAAGAAAALHRRPSGVGWIRDVGVRHLLGRLRTHTPESIWLLSTDADTTVPPDWATAHLSFAAGGAHGVAGLADLRSVARLSPGALARYEALVAGGLHGDRHDHVYAANLGFRADAYLAVGGFPGDGHGEEHGLWRRMTVAGYRLVAPSGVRVRTSARIRGRATGGLADLLRSMHRPPLRRGGA